MARFTMRGAILQAISDGMDRDPSILVIGEGARVKYSLDRPSTLVSHHDRILTAPVAEGGVVGVALGAAMEGMHPIVDLTFSDLTLRAMDEIVNHVAKVGFMTGGKVRAPVVVKADFNRPENAQSGNRLESFFLHVPGLRVFIPSTPSDAYHFMAHALRGRDPVLYFEDRIIDAPQEIGTLHPPVGKARVVRQGKSLTIVSYGCTVGITARTLERDEYADAELIDLRSLNPLDLETISASVDRTGRLLIVEPDHVRFGIGAEIAATISERCFRALEAPVRRVGTEDMLFPAVTALHAHMLPVESKIRGAIAEMLGTDVRGRPERE